MNTATPWWNKQAREAMGRKLRTSSEFEAFLVDHFPDTLRRMPPHGDRLQLETILIQCVGAQNILHSMYGRWYYSITIAPLLFRVGSPLLLLFSVFWLLGKAGNRHFFTQATSMQSISSEPTLSFRGDSTSLPASTNQNSRESGEKASILPKVSQHNRPKTKHPTPCNAQLALVTKSDFNHLEIANLPAMHGYARGTRLALFAKESRTNSLLPIFGIGVVTNISSNSIEMQLEFGPKKQLPLELCAGRLDKDRFGRIIGQIIDINPLRINLGAGDGVTVGDRYEVLGGIVSDATLNGETLGRDANGLLHVSKTHLLFSEVILIYGNVEKSAYVQLKEGAK